MPPKQIGPTEVIVSDVDLNNAPIGTLLNATNRYFGRSVKVLRYCIDDEKSIEGTCNLLRVSPKREGVTVKQYADPYHDKHLILYVSQSLAGEICERCTLIACPANPNHQEAQQIIDV